MKPNVNIALLGFGTVAGGTYDIFRMNRETISSRTGIDFRVRKILVRDKKKAEAHGISERAVTDPEEIFSDKSIDIVVEAIGGIEPAAEYMLRAMRAGKHVVTPNKAALAEHYHELRAEAKACNVEFRFEASVGGGIPALTSVQEALAGNEFTEMQGIVNGTTNYILTQMTDHGLPYTEALHDAQKKGFAEADPTADVEGIDAANKLSIMMALCFDKYVKPDRIPRKGITGVTMDDISSAKKHGNKIKLIARARNMDDYFEYGVEPVEIPADHPLAGVSNEFNAIYITGNAVGELMFYGKGAGALPTGSAVAGDIIAIGKNIRR